ncbi:hypothetical protein C5469_06280 [Photorhabdus cinerea]|uniref:HTH deoR-type domain-containing protein n=1 Tax=Photorhabdus cinerea TaxID=471575 RepID=A0A7X5TGU3_9GAMM|nr:hypothetical protein [Photorhabdus cinerea]
MLPSERRDFIYRYVHEYRTISISALVELMNVSHMTVRRDIRTLEEEGKVISISGGVQLSWPGNFDISRSLSLAFYTDGAFSDTIRAFITNNMFQNGG